MTIRSFKSKELREFFEIGKVPRKVGWGSLEKVARRKLDLLNFAQELKDLKSPPSNHLEKLMGDLYGYYSIRINAQWRIIFQWEDCPYNIEIVDYH
jgi:proteic killer suppression protein